MSKELISKTVSLPLLCELIRTRQNGIRDDFRDIEQEYKSFSITLYDSIEKRLCKLLENDEAEVILEDIRSYGTYRENISFIDGVKIGAKLLGELLQK